MDPNASRETLDHSIMYIFAVALEDGDWHHVKSYTKTRANKKSTIKIWKSITTYEDKKWTKKYHNPNQKLGKKRSQSKSKNNYLATQSFI